MGFDGDFEAWRAYIKGVRKLKFGRESPDWNRSICNNIAKHKQDVLETFFRYHKSRSPLSVNQLSCSERRKFKSQGEIDLHGYTRDIDRTLAIFCAESILHNVNNVTIISGKGRGIVKSATEVWLRSHPEFVIAFFEIKDSLGESGAFGVKLRKK